MSYREVEPSRFFVPGAFVDLEHVIMVTFHKDAGTEIGTIELSNGSSVNVTSEFAKKVINVLKEYHGLT